MGLCVRRAKKFPHAVLMMTWKSDNKGKELRKLDPPRSSRHQSRPSEPQSQQALSLHQLFLPLITLIIQPANQQRVQHLHLHLPDVVHRVGLHVDVAEQVRHVAEGVAGRLDFRVVG